MEMRFQDLNFAVSIIEKQFRRNRNRSISATFHSLRRNSKLSFFGDWLLLGVIIKTIHQLGIYPSRNSILYAMNMSPELSKLPKREKTLLLEQLLKPSPVAMKQTKIASG